MPIRLTGPGAASRRRGASRSCCERSRGILPDAGPRPPTPLSTGLFSVFRAFGQLARLPKAWPYALVPTLVFALLAGFGVWLLFVVDLFVPPATVVTVPVRIVVTALTVAWNLIDYPLTLRGMRVRQRLALVRVEWRSFLGFGLGFAAVFWIPCCGIVLLPIGV